MKKEIEEFVKSLIKKKVEKSQETKEVNVEGIFKSTFRLGSTLEERPYGNVVANVRKHNPDNDLKKAYGGSPRKITK